MLGHVDSMLDGPRDTIARLDETRPEHKHLSLQITWADGGSTAPSVPLGDHIGKATPVPIPNTVVKLFEPMIVPKVRK